MKKISGEVLYEAMEGIGDDLLMRSEELSVAACGKKAVFRFPKRIITGIAAVAALLLITVLTKNTLRFSGAGSSSSPQADEAKPAVVTENAEEEVAVSEEESMIPEAGVDMGMDTYEEADEDAEKQKQIVSAQASENGGNESIRDAEKLEAYSADSVTEEAAATGMAAFFVYRGTVYMERDDSRVKTNAVDVGNFVTHIVLAMDGGTEEAAYKDGRGNLEGDVYTVRGEDPAKVLCIPDHDGTVLLLYAEEP